MRADIKFAGISLAWSKPYAKSYSEKLYEMGQYAKVIEMSEYCLVAYSYKPFCMSDVLESLKNLEKIEGTGGSTGGQE